MSRSSNNKQPLKIVLRTAFRRGLAENIPLAMGLLFAVLLGLATAVLVELLVDVEVTPAFVVASLAISAAHFRGLRK